MRNFDEIKAHAEANGWTTANPDVLPKRFSNCISVKQDGYEIIATQNAETGSWGWLATKWAQWGRGERLGTAATLDKAMRDARAAVNADTATLF